MKKKKVKPVVKMKPLEEDPCPTCLYGKARNQHNVPKAVENFNKVKPSEAFGKGAKKAPKAKKTRSVNKKKSGVNTTFSKY